MGRPSKYEPRFCEELAEHFTEGYSFESFGGVARVSKQTLYDWCEAHPEFLDAKKANETASQLVWEQRLRSLAVTGDGNATAIIFGLKNRASDSWRDVKATEITGRDGGPVATQDLTRLSNAELETIASEGEG